jgi:hypothetical protein
MCRDAVGTIRGGGARVEEGQDSAEEGAVIIVAW